MNLWQRAIKELREAVKAKFIEFPTTLFGFTPTARSSAGGNADFVSSDDSAQRQRPVRRIQPFGFISRAPEGVRALTLKLGSSNVFFVGVAHSGYAPGDLQDGESAMYCKVGGITVKLTKDGDVVVNGGTQAVARVTDDLTASSGINSMGQWAAIVESTLTYLMVHVAGQPDPFSLPNTKFADTAGQPGAFGEIHSGAAHFKG